VTQQDSQQLAAISGRAIDVVENGVDTAAYASIQPDSRSRRIMFVGNYDYPPNAAAVELTIEQILPAIWGRCPGARFSVCGAGIPDTWRRRWTDSRIEWRGFVPDLSVEQRRSAMLLAPLTAGGGSKLKVLESMAAGLAVVGTREAVSGLHVQEGREYCEGRTPGELAAHVVGLFENESRIREMGERAREYVQRRHDWRPLVSRMADILRELPRRL
jgi:glycosyltransferase involved in cell wall biosynthesis